MKQFFLSILIFSFYHSAAHAKVLVIGIAGGSAAGKSYLAHSLQERLFPDAAIVALDDYGVAQPKLSLEERMRMNWDHPQVVNVALVVEHINQLKEGHEIEIPIPDLKNFARSSMTRVVQPSSIVILEGLHVLSIPEIRELVDVKVYIDISDDIRLARRIQRDINERGAQLSILLEQYFEHVKPMHDRYIAPSKERADIVLSGDNLEEELLEYVVSVRD